MNIIENNAEEFHQGKNEQINYSKMFCLFMMGSVIGFFLEGIWHMLRKGVWESHTATVWGPFCIIYGIAAMLLYALSIALRGKNSALQFVIYALSGTLVEYISGLFQEICFGSKSWNYSKHFLNINGRISLQMTLLWGMLGIFFAKLLLPLFTRLLRKIQGKRWKIACIVLTVFMVVNLAVTSSAILRWRDRMNDIPAMTQWESFLDEAYDNETMGELFPNMVFQDKK